MRMMYILIGIVVLSLVYVRVAPSDPARWHRPISAQDAGETTGRNSYLVVKSGVTPDQFAHLVAVAGAASRTESLDGDESSGLFTFVTRSRLIGFPDYTTIQLVGDVLSIQARSRFGYGDGGVNRARVLAWLAAADL